MKININKILEKMKERNEAEYSPSLLFFILIERSYNLLDDIQNKIEEEESIQEARKQYVIRLTTAFEIYLRELFIKLIDKYEFDPSYLINKLNIKFNFEDVQNIRDKNIPTGIILSEFFNFQNLQDIDKSFSNLLYKYKKNKNICFFDELIIFSEGGECNTLKRLQHNLYQILNEMLQLRHRVVHEMDFNQNIDLNDLKHFYYYITDFVWVLDDYLYSLNSNWKTLKN